MLSRPRSPQHATLSVMSRKVDTPPSLIIWTRPPCSTTKSRFGSRRGAERWTGMTKPVCTSTVSSVAPEPVGTPAQRAGFTLSSWQVGEQPSPGSVLPSSHSSSGPATPSPQLAEPTVLVVDELVVVVVVVVAAGGWRADAASATKASTCDSMAAASPVVVQPPLASALANPAANLVSHPSRHSGSTGTPSRAAFDTHLSLQDDFLPPARILAAAQSFSAG